MRGVADEDQAVSGPVRDVREVVGVVAGQLQGPGGDELGARPGIGLEEVDEVALPLIGARGGAPLAGDLRFAGR